MSLINAIKNQTVKNARGICLFANVVAQTYVCQRFAAYEDSRSLKKSPTNPQVPMLEKPRV